jgi:hypothetical protein
MALAGDHVHAHTRHKEKQDGTRKSRDEVVEDEANGMPLVLGVYHGAAY